MTWRWPQQAEYNGRTLLDKGFSDMREIARAFNQLDSEVGRKNVIPPSSVLLKTGRPVHFSVLESRAMEGVWFQDLFEIDFVVVTTDPWNNNGMNVPDPVAVGRLQKEITFYEPRFTKAVRAE